MKGFFDHEESVENIGFKSEELQYRGISFSAIVRLMRQIPEPCLAYVAHCIQSTFTRSVHYAVYFPARRHSSYNSYFLIP
jgi:hypothetical protein